MDGGGRRRCPIGGPRRSVSACSGAIRTLETSCVEKAGQDQRPGTWVRPDPFGPTDGAPVNSRGREGVAVGAMTTALRRFEG